MPIEIDFKQAKSLALWPLLGAFVASSFSNSFFEIFSGVFLVFSLLLVVLEKRYDIFKNIFAVAVGLYLLTVILSLTRSEYAAASLRGVFRVLRCVLMSFFVVYVVDDEGKFKKVFYVFAAGALLIGLDALVQGFFNVEFLRNRSMTHYTEEIMRVTGPFRHANDFSAYLSLVIFIFLGMMSYAVGNKSWKQRGLYFGGALVLGTCLLWTFSRGAWLAVAFACILMAILKRSRLVILALFVALALIFFLSPAPLEGRITSLWNIKDGTITERRQLWGEALRMVGERPWLGYGVNTYAKVEPRFKSKDFYTDNQYAHNGYLQIAAETGWLGLIAFLGVLVCFFSQAFKAPPKYQDEFLSAAAFSLTLGILSFLIHSATDTDLQSLRLVSLLWLTMGLVLAAKKISEKTVQ